MIDLTPEQEAEYNHYRDSVWPPSPDPGKAIRQGFTALAAGALAVFAIYAFIAVMSAQP